MIAASRRRRTQRQEVFGLHDALARRNALSVRLRRGAAAALGASLIALALQASLGQHLLAVALGLALGAALPVRGARSQALSFIRGRAGLSYETALGIIGTDDEDEFGLGTAVVERARLAVRDVRPEPAPAWWLPALAVAVGLALFSLGGPAGAGAGGGSGGGSLPQGGASPSAPAAGAEAEEPGDDEAAGPGEDETERASGDPEARPGQDEVAEGGGAGAPPSDGAGGAPLSRFLESLRERPETEAARVEPVEPGDEGATSSAAAGRPAQGQGPIDPELAERDPVDPADRPDGEGEEGDGSGAGDGEPGDDGASGDGDQESEAGGDDAADRPGGEQGGEQGGAEQGPDGSDGDGGSEQMPADGGEGAGEPGPQGDEGSESLSGDPSEGAGAGAGGVLDAGVADGEGTEPDLLPGVLQFGPENPAGVVRLPGEGEVALPPGRSPADYRSAAEEALTEGDLPLAYQEVIRRYFR